MLPPPEFGGGPDGTPICSVKQIIQQRLAEEAIVGRVDPIEVLDFETPEMEPFGVSPSAKASTPSRTSPLASEEAAKGKIPCTVVLAERNTDGDLVIAPSVPGRAVQPSHSGKFPESALFLQELSQVIWQQYGSKLQIASQQSISLQPTEPFDS